jgi:DNA-binding transcriptional ArsR family regulator
MGQRTGHRTIVDISDIGSVPVRFRVSPHGDATLLASDALGPTNGGTPTGLKTVVRRALGSASGTTGLPLLVHPTTFAIWEGLMPAVRPSSTAYGTFEDIDRDHDEFRSSSQQEYGDRMPAAWRAALARPGPFFDAYVRDCHSVWDAFRPRLGDLRPILEREVERVQTAVARQAVPELLTSTIPGAWLDGNRLVMPSRRDLRLTLTTDGLTLGPMLTGVRCRCFVVRPGTSLLTALWYPVRVGQPVSPRPTAADSLAALLGAPRTTLLLGLDRAATASELAELVDTSPSGITHHVDLLVAAGLVERQRQGRHILVVRTVRGDRLLDLYSH